MGAWGAGVFEDDFALNWRNILIYGDDINPFMVALSQIKEGVYLEIPEYSAAAIAAEINCDPTKQST